MIQANQKAVLQSANRDVIEIRRLEIDYFSNFFGSFGTQAALVAGFCSGVNLIDTKSAVCPQFCVFLYTVCTTIAFILSMHTLLCSAFISVFGQGLALRGPVGSMAKAVDEMVIEQQHVILSFCLAIMFFTFGSIGVHFLLMSELSAILCSVVTLSGMAFWYARCIRIYNRFKFADDRRGSMYDNSDELKFGDSAYYERHHKLINNFKDTDKIRTGGGLPQFGPPKDVNFDLSKLTSSDGSGFRRRGPVRAFGAWLFGLDQTSYGSSNSNNSNNMNVEMLSVQNMSQQKTNLVYYEGYLETKIRSDKGILKNTVSGERWKARYMILKHTFIFIFKTKKDYDEYPNRPMRRRPIDLDGLQLDFVSTNTYYSLILKPIGKSDERNPIEFRCSNLKDATNWIEKLNLAIRNALEENQSPINSKSSDIESIESNSPRSTSPTNVPLKRNNFHIGESIPNRQNSGDHTNSSTIITTTAINEDEDEDADADDTKSVASTSTSKSTATTVTMSTVTTAATNKTKESSTSSVQYLLRSISPKRIGKEKDYITETASVTSSGSNTSNSRSTATNPLHKESDGGKK